MGAWLGVRGVVAGCMHDCKCRAIRLARTTAWKYECALACRGVFAWGSRAVQGAHWRDTCQTRRRHMFGRALADKRGIRLIICLWRAQREFISCRGACTFRLRSGRAGASANVPTQCCPACVIRSCHLGSKLRRSLRGQRGCRAMSGEKDAKYRRIESLRRKCPHMSATALSALLDGTQYEPFTASRREIRDARDAVMNQQTQYGALFGEIECNASPSPMRFTVANLPALLCVAFSQCESWRDLINRTLATKPSTFDRP
eukprot:4526151-Pyramimonas_sp.AAC.3